MKSSRKKLFIENLFIYGLGSCMNMIIPFIMLPIISRLLPGSQYYGINDMVNIFIAFGTAVGTMGMYDAMYRFYFDKNDLEYSKEVCTSTLVIVSIVSFLVMLATLIFRKSFAGMLFNDYDYVKLVIIGGLSIWVSCINSIVAAPTRMQNQRLRYIAIQTLMPVISYTISIWLILRGDYIYALPLASLSSNILACITFFALNKRNFSLKYFNINLLKPMLRFGIPLMPTVVFFWVISSAGRVFITNTSGLFYAGIYAAASKIASISQLIYSAFSSGWQYFAFSTMKDDDYIGLISKIFDYLVGITSFSTSLLILFLKPIFFILLPREYAEGIAIAPILFMAPLILMLRQTIGMHFQVKKMSLTGALTIGFGAVVSLCLYIILIPVIDIKGAAVASVSGYLFSLIITLLLLRRMKLINISTRVYICSFTVAPALIFNLINAPLKIILAMALLNCIIIIILYYKDVTGIVRNILKKN